jgi:hypothetical protein
MLKWITAIVLLLGLSLLTVCYLGGRSLRHAGIIEGRALLKIAAKDLSEYGYVTNVSSSTYRFWRSTNVATIGGTQYQCFAEVGGGLLGEAGTLAVTTNQTFIWLDRQRPPKIVGPDYRPPLFPPRF